MAKHQYLDNFHPVFKGMTSSTFDRHWNVAVLPWHANQGRRGWAPFPAPLSLVNTLPLSGQHDSYHSSSHLPCPITHPVSGSLLLHVSGPLTGRKLPEVRYHIYPHHYCDFSTQHRAWLVIGARSIWNEWASVKTSLEGFSRKAGGDTETQVTNNFQISHTMLDSHLLSQVLQWVKLGSKSGKTAMWVMDAKGETGSLSWYFYQGNETASPDSALLTLP